VLQFCEYIFDRQPTISTQNLFAKTINLAASTVRACRFIFLYGITAFKPP